MPNLFSDLSTNNTNFMVMGAITLAGSIGVFSKSKAYRIIGINTVLGYTESVITNMAPDCISQVQSKMKSQTTRTTNKDVNPLNPIIASMRLSVIGGAQSCFLGAVLACIAQFNHSKLSLKTEIPPFQFFVSRAFMMGPNVIATIIDLIIFNLINKSITDKQKKLKISKYSVVSTVDLLNKFYTTFGIGSCMLIARLGYDPKFKRIPFVPFTESFNKLVNRELDLYKRILDLNMQMLDLRVD